MTKSERWTLQLTDGHLAAIEPEIRAFLSVAGVEGRAAYVSHLVIEEVVRNLIVHTPPYATDESVTVTATVTDSSVA